MSLRCLGGVSEVSRRCLGGVALLGDVHQEAMQHDVLAQRDGDQRELVPRRESWAEGSEGGGLRGTEETAKKRRWAGRRAPSSWQGGAL